MGWAFFSDVEGAQPFYGLRENPDYGENDVMRLQDIRKAVVTLVRDYEARKGRKVERIYCEQIIIRTSNINVDTIYSQFVVYAGVVAASVDLGIPLFTVPIGSWRARFLGLGGAPKWVKKNRTDWLKQRALIECASRGFLISYDPKPDVAHNIAEAIGIAEFGLGHASIPYRARTKFEVRKRKDKAAIEERLG